MSNDLDRVLRSTGPVEELVQGLRDYGYEQIGYLQINEKCLDAADLIEAQTAEITRLRACIVKLEEALDAASRVLHKAGEQFNEYAKQHAAKGTAVSDLKADFNKQWAERCFSAYWRASEGGKDE